MSITQNLKNKNVLKTTEKLLFCLTVRSGTGIIKQYTFQEVIYSLFSFPRRCQNSFYCSLAIFYAEAFLRSYVRRLIKKKK
jgi:hypothetical protein